MGGGERRLGIGVIAVAAICAAAACYPTFQFDGTGGSATQGTGESASSGVRPTGGNTTSTSTSTSTSTLTSTATTTSTANATTTTTSTSTAATSSGSGISSVGAPCDVGEPMACVAGQICCFELSTTPTDQCVGSCEIDQDGDFFRDHVSLGCNEDSDCGGSVCCIQYTIAGNLRGTYCQASCEPGIEDRACDPLFGGCAGGACVSLLADEYGGASPPPPYDRYGVCQ